MVPSVIRAIIIRDVHNNQGFYIIKELVTKCFSGKRYLVYKSVALLSLHPICLVP